MKLTILLCIGIIIGTLSGCTIYTTTSPGYYGGYYTYPVTYYPYSYYPYYGYYNNGPYYYHKH